MPSIGRPRKNRFTRNSAGIQAFLTHDPGIISLMERAGEAVASAYNARGVEGMNGEIVATVETGVSTWPGHPDRYAAQVIARDGKAVPLEAKYGYLKEATTSSGLEWGRKSD